MNSKSFSRHFMSSILIVSILISIGCVAGKRVKRDDEPVTEAPLEEVEATESIVTPEPEPAPNPENEGAEDSGDHIPESDTLEPTPDTTGQSGDTEESKFKDVPKTVLTTPMEWIDRAIKQHNRFREMHNAPPLTFNKELSEIAQAYANEMAKTLKFQHSKFAEKAGLGESLYYSSNSEKTDIEPETAVTAWYEEIKDYDFATGFEKPRGSGAEILHFTQLVWLGSKEVGIAFATTDEKNDKGMYTTYVVANYFPRGNFQNFLKNVLPLDKTSKGKIPGILDDVEKNVKDVLNDSVSKGKNELENVLAGSSNKPFFITSLILLPLIYHFLF